MNTYYTPDINILECFHVVDCEGWNYPDMVTPFWRIYWNETPGGFITYKDKMLTMLPDKIVMIPGYTVFTSKSVQPFNQLYTHFSVNAPFDSITDRIYAFETEEMERTFVGEIIEVLDNSPKNVVQYSLLIHSFVNYILAKIPEKDITPCEMLDERVLKAMSLFKDNSTQLLSNQELAEKVNMSMNGFVRLFTKEVGVSPQKYHRLKRIEKACMELLYSPKSIEEIALETGFLDRYHFSREFKKATSFSPAEYRARKMI